MIIRLSPKLSQDLNGLMPQSSITWDESSRLPQYNIEKFESEVREDDTGTPRKGRSRHRPSTSVSFKGKEKGPTIYQQAELAPRQPNSAVDNFTTEPPEAHAPALPNSDTVALDARSLSLQENHNEGRLSPIQPLSPLNDSIRRTMTEGSDLSVKLAQAMGCFPGSTDKAEEGDPRKGTAPSGDKEQE